MKLLVLFAVVAFSATPALACDLHGMFGDDGYGPRTWLTDEEVEAERRQAIAAARAALVARFLPRAAPDASKSAEGAEREQIAETAAVSTPRDKLP